LNSDAKGRIWSAAQLEEPDMAITNPLQFMQQVRAEVSKIVWPNRREVTVTTGMVFVMAAIFAIFFFSVDQIVKLILETILSIAG
jgi:preprotein translocase subunit SecE